MELAIELSLQWNHRHFLWMCVQEYVWVSGDCSIYNYIEAF